MAHYVISVDAGNGHVQACSLKRNKLEFVNFASIRAEVSGKTYGLEDFAIDAPYVDYEGVRYVVGDVVLDVTEELPDDVIGKYRYGSEHHCFLIAYAVAQFSPARNSTVHLVTYAPPEMLESAKRGIIEALQDISVSIHLKGEKTPHSWTYSEITVIPEGAGAGIGIMFDNTGKPSGQADLVGNVAILDMGMHTLDVAVLANGKFNPNNIHTYEELGALKNILEPALAEVKDAIGNDARFLRTHHIDRALVEGTLSQFRLAGKIYNIEPIIQKHTARYAKRLVNNIINKDLRALDGYAKAILVGGLSHYVGDTFTDDTALYDKIFVYDGLTTTKDIHPAYANAVGGIRLMAAREKA